MRYVLYIFFFVFLTQNLANAQNRETSPKIEEKLSIFFGNLTGYMNQKDTRRIERFLSKHSSSNLEFAKKIIKVSSTNDKLQPQFEIEDIKMNLKEYRDFLEGFFKSVSDYIINYKIISFQYDKENDVIFANVEFKEYATVKEYNQETRQFMKKKIYINSNCSYSFSSTSGLPQMYYSNCAEKIVKN